MGGETRAVANVVGIVILVAVVLSAATIIAGFSARSMTEQTRAFAGETAVADLTGLAEGVESVAYGGRDRTRVAVAGSDSTQGRQLQPIDDGRLTVAIGSTATGWQRVADVSLGAVGVRAGATTVAYQGGGVWRVSESGDGARVVRAPPLSVVVRSATTITLPVFALGERRSITGDASVALVDQRPLHEPIYVADQAAVRITVRSRFAGGWATAFRRAFPGPQTSVSLDESNEVVTVTYTPRTAEELYLHGSIHRIDVGPA